MSQVKGKSEISLITSMEGGDLGMKSETNDCRTRQLEVSA